MKRCFRNLSGVISEVESHIQNCGSVLTYKIIDRRPELDPDGN